VCLAIHWLFGLALTKSVPSFLSIHAATARSYHYYSITPAQIAIGNYDWLLWIILSIVRNVSDSPQQINEIN
jgi:hypothetical protein